MGGVLAEWCAGLSNPAFVYKFQLNIDVNLPPNCVHSARVCVTASVSGVLGHVVILKVGNELRFLNP